MNHMYQMVAKTQFGLEGVLAKELVELGAQEVEEHNRAVSFKGDKAIMYKANLCLRTALKVLVPIQKFIAGNEQKLYDEIKKIDWSQYLDEDGTLVVHTSLKSDYFNHSQYVSLKTKDAIVDQFRENTGIRPNIDLINPDLSVDIHINRDEVTVSLDSSTESLHRRGYRSENTLAPINEVTAAGMILLTGWDGKGTFMDPMCGSGTLLIEAGLIAKNIPANMLREKFGFETWKDFEADTWEKVKKEAIANIRKSEATIIGSDKTYKAIEITRENIAHAHLSEDIRVSNKQFEEVKPPEGGGIVVMNPPYGERLPIEEIDAFYKAMGDKMKKDFEGFSVWIISSNIAAMKKIGLAASKRLNLFNGALECKYHRFDIYKGTRDKRKLEAQTK